MKIYFDWIKKRPVFRRGKPEDVDRYPSVVNSGVDGDVYSLTYRLVNSENQVIKFSYSQESLEYFPYEKQLEAFLQGHGLKLLDISPIPVRISVPPEEYEFLESELLEQIKKYKRVKIRGREGTYAYDEANIYGWETKVHIVELDEWVGSNEIETKEFHEELKKAIDYLNKYSEYGSYDGVFMRYF